MVTLQFAHAHVHQAMSLSARIYGGPNVIKGDILLMWIFPHKLIRGGRHFMDIGVRLRLPNTGAFGESEKKKSRASGGSRSKWAKLIINFATFRWKLLQIWRKNRFSLRKISKIWRHLASKFQFVWTNGGFGWQHTILWTWVFLSLWVRL